MIIKKLNHLVMEQITGDNSIVFGCLACGMVIAVNSGAVHAADWVISPSIGLSHIYTDNVNLTNEDPVSDNVTVLSPTLSILKEGGRASLDFNYAPQYRHYRDGTSDNEVVHFMRTEGNVELAENHLFIDGWLRADRTNITSTGRTGIDGITGAEDDTDYYTLGISPYLTGRLGNFSVVEARLTGDKVNYSEELDNDSTGKRAEIAFGSGSMFTNQIWELLLQQSDVEYQNLDVNNETQIIRAEYIQKLTQQWALSFSVGYENYELAVTEDRDDTTWSVGAIYTPNPRTSIALGVGERSFGDDYYFDFSHRSSRTIWTARYEQDFISAREELRAQPLFERLDAFGEMVRDPILESFPVTTRGAYSPTITEDYYESKRFSTEFTYQTGRTSIGLQAVLQERIYDREGRDTEDIEVGLLIQRRLSRLMSGFIHVIGADHEQETLTYDQLSTSLGVNYQIGQDSRISLSLAHYEREAETDDNSYEENRASIGFVTEL
ncbi:MAG: TIGR03016 family PEP-CTERM system-associated outer membrane protein [Candidatus Thiodiazotropha sp.]